MGLSVEQFYNLLFEEINNNKELQGYYRFWNTSDKSYLFRKAYYCQRLQYIYNHVGDVGNTVWDCGCGYGTTAIFLALNGYKVYGSTLEYYYQHIEKRLEYWKKHGDVSNLHFNYQNLFDEKIEANSYDVIIAQDTLHHLEPLADALGILKDALKSGGKLVAIEENGSNIIQNIKLYKQRGNKKIITIYDEKLNKEILLGNENIKSESEWVKWLAKQGLEFNNESVQYVRLFPPNFYKNENYNEIIEKEQRLWKSNRILRKYFFFGLNFVAINK